jgi:hypothetical protein
VNKKEILQERWDRLQKEANDISEQIICLRKEYLEESLETEYLKKNNLPYKKELMNVLDKEAKIERLKARYDLTMQLKGHVIDDENLL